MKILVAGDFRPNSTIAELFEKNDFKSILGGITSITNQADYSIINFESPIVIRETSPIKKIGPCLKCKESGLKAIKWAGFDCITLANNHFYDYGESGVEDTIESCNKNGVDYVGGGINLAEASRVLYKEIAGHRLAVINCCEREFSIASENSAGSNPLNPIQQYYDILEARKNADRVLVIVHGGVEHFQLPTPRMVETYRFFIDAGADAIVNHHQHCFSGYEVYNGKPIFYGLGNFCFLSNTDRSGKWTEGYVVIIDFSDQTPSFQLFPYIQNAVELGVYLQNQDQFDTEIHRINELIAKPKELREAVEQYYENQEGVIANLLEPLRNKYYLFAKKKGWFPSLISKEKLLLTKNIVSCESHCDKLLWWLTKALKNKN